MAATIVVQLTLPIAGRSEPDAQTAGNRRRPRADRDAGGDLVRVTDARAAITSRIAAVSRAVRVSTCSCESGPTARRSRARAW
jgi:hypothetical protein